MWSDYPYRRVILPFLAALMSAGCASSARESVAPAVARTLNDAPIQIDISHVLPLSTPLNVGMKPTKPVDYTYVLDSPSNNGFLFVAKGQISFERQQNGTLAQITRITSGEMENPQTAEAIPLPLSIQTRYEFDPTGEIWAIREPIVSIPEAKPSNRLSDVQWEQFRKAIREEYSYESGNPAFECAGQVFGLNGQSITTGFPMTPQNLEEFVSRISVCTLAAIRGGDPIADEDYRQRLLSASPHDLAEMLSDQEATYRDQFSKTLTYSSDVQIRGSVVERGQEFLLADGVTHVRFRGITMISSVSALIDPFTGLPYKARNRMTMEGNPTAPEDAELVRNMNGTETSVQTDLPQAVPQVVTVTEPKPTVTTSSGVGSLSDIYTKSVGAVYLVAAGSAMGTGFAISPTEAITAAHVVEGQSSAVLRGPSGQTFQADIVASDARRDVALLRIRGGSFPSALGLSGDFPAIGAQVAVIGCPFDPALCGTLTTGVVSFSNRPVDGINYVQVDAAINQGNSGGPILNLDGDVVAIAEFKIADPSFVGLSFGLSSTEIRNFLSERSVLVSERPVALLAP